MQSNMTMDGGERATMAILSTRFSIRIFSVTKTDTINITPSFFAEHLSFHLYKLLMHFFPGIMSVMRYV